MCRETYLPCPAGCPSIGTRGLQYETKIASTSVSMDLSLAICRGMQSRVCQWDPAWRRTRACAWTAVGAMLVPLAITLEDTRREAYR